MGRTSIVPENRVSTDTERFPAFKFSMKGEHGRIACLERQQLPNGANVLVPWMEFVHRMETVEEKDGQPLQKERKWKGKDGQEHAEMVWATQWVSSPICLGDKAVLLDKGMDVGNCPVCKASQDNPEITQHRGLGAPIVRYAMNVVKFSLRPGGFILAEPFGAQILVWAFTEKRFNRLDDLNRKLAERGELQFRTADGAVGVRPFDITDVDLLLGPCEDANMQKYEIDVAEGQAMWRRSAPTVQYIQQLWLGAGMRATDDQLQLACGKPVTNRGYLDSDILKVVTGWNKALRGGPAPSMDPFGASFSGAQGAQDMTTGMGTMLDTLGAQAAGVPAVPQPAVAPAQAPTVQPQQPPAVPQVPATPQPTVQPTPAGPPPPAAQYALPPAPPTPEQMAAAGGGYGLEQFAPPPLQAPPGQPLAQAAAPGWGMTGLQAPGVPADPMAVPQAPAPPQPIPAAPAAAPAPPASTVPPTGTSTIPAPAAAPDLFAAPVPTAAPQGAAVEFDVLADF
jgi:hypothetical protein